MLNCIDASSPPDFLGNSGNPWQIGIWHILPILAPLCRGSVFLVEFQQRLVRFTSSSLRRCKTPVQARPTVEVPELQSQYT